MQDWSFYTKPFFWALLSMLGMVGAASLFSRHMLKSSSVFVAAVLTLVTAGRIVLVLPFCPQPRFDAAGWHWIMGAALLLLALLVAAEPLIKVRWWSGPEAGMKLSTTGIYAVVRHPIYLAELLWPLGLAVIFRSTYGVMLTPLWWLAFLVHALSEEADLERTLGEEYLAYERKVRGRILPLLPF
jgi:protein-S-isoprenylcysteine O-methyltransferase Ste14